MMNEVTTRHLQAFNRFSLGTQREVFVLGDVS